MEVTKQDKKHIDELVRNMNLRMVDEATEYAQACERYYYEQLKSQVEMHLEVLNDYHDNLKRVYNT